MTVFPPERPIRLFRSPEPIEVPATEMPEGPPMNFRWRRALYRVARAEGPERIAPEWWREQGSEEAPTRDYFRIEDATAAATGSTAKAFTAPRKSRRAGSCMGFSHERADHHPLCRIRHPVEFLLPARRLEAGGTGGGGQAPGILGDRACRPQHGGRRGARLAAGQGREASPIIPAAAWFLATARRTFSPIRRTARAGAISAAC